MAAGIGVSWVQRPARVRAPATSANLGPGFDALGLALALYDEVEARVTDHGLAIEVSGEGTETAGLGEQHLVVRAMRAAFGRLGGQPQGIALKCRNAIPHGRGLGSSAAAIVSGLLVARALVMDGESALPDGALLGLAADLEGHPDNVAACLAGGLTIAWRPRPAEGAGATGGGGSAAGSGPGGTGGGPGAPGDGREVVRNGPGAAGGGLGGGPGDPRLARIDVPDTVSAVVCVPPLGLSTSQARRALPAAVPHADAAANAGRSAMLVAALTGQPGLLFDATEDYLHQRYRAPAMPHTAELVRRLRQAGVAAVISGAGPGVLALITPGHGPGPEAVDSIAREAGIAWHVIPLDIDRRGATLQPGGLAAHTPSTGRRGFWNQGSGSGTPAAGGSQIRPLFSATLGPPSRECRGLLWC